MTPSPAELRSLAETAAHGAGRILLSLFGSEPTGLDVKSSPTDMVSDADRLSEAFILDTIWRERPQDLVLAEEGGDRACPGSDVLTVSLPRVRWIVDPLDGTTNWLHGLSAWGVSIAAEMEGRVVSAVVHAPLRGETFSAAVGEPTSVSSVDLNLRTPTSPGASDLPLVATGFSYDPDVRSLQAALLTRVMGRVRDIRREGSAALDLAYVAAGRLDAFYEAPLAPWDMAAGRLLVVQAGGIVKPLRLPGIPGEGVIAGRAEVVETVESSIRGWHAPEASQPPRQ